MSSISFVYGLVTPQILGKKNPFKTYERILFRDIYVFRFLFLINLCDSFINKVLMAKYARVDNAFIAIS